MVAYKEDQLPKNIRKLTKQTFGNYNITLVEEIQERSRNAYFIHLENDDSVKVVCLLEGEFYMVHDFVKG